MRCIWVGVGFYFRTFTITSGLDRAAAFSQMFTNSSGERFKKFGSNRARRDGAAPFKVWPYVDDAMFAELRIEERRTTVSRVEDGAANGSLEMMQSAHKRLNSKENGQQTTYCLV